MDATCVSARPGSVKAAVRLTPCPSETTPPAAAVVVSDWIAGATLFTATPKLRVALSGGEALSVTRTVTTADEGPSTGVHVKTPVTGSMAAPAGAASRL